LPYAGELFTILRVGPTDAVSVFTRVRESALAEQVVEESTPSTKRKWLAAFLACRFRCSVFISPGIRTRLRQTAGPDGQKDSRMHLVLG